MCDDYDNPFGMSEQEFEYRAMDPEDPMYMGDRNKSYPSPYYGQSSPATNSKEGKKKGNHKSNQPANPDDVKVLKDMPEPLFLTLCMLVVIGLIALGIWLLTVL